MNKLKTSLSILAFSFGILFAYDITAQIYLAVANGLESFNSGVNDDFDPMPINCPEVVSIGEDAIVSVKIPTNTSESIYHYSVNGRVDDGLLRIQSVQQVELDVPPGEGIEVSRRVGGANPEIGYLVVRIRAVAGDMREAPSFRREIAYQGRCGIAVVSYLGLRGLHTVILIIGIHFMGVLLLYRFAYDVIPKSTAMRIYLFTIAVLAVLGLAATLLPIPQGHLLGFLIMATLYLNPLLILLFIGLYLSGKIISWLKSLQTSG